MQFSRDASSARGYHHFKSDMLLTWVGARDPFWQNPRTKQREPGPIISLLEGRRFDTVYLFFNLDSDADDFRQRANAVFQLCRRDLPEMRVVHRPVDLVSVIDYLEIFRVMNHECQAVLAETVQEDNQYYVYLSPGTPQMQTVWVLLVQSGLLPARMIEATPRDLLAPGAPYWREVDLSIPDFPQVANPSEIARLVGVLETQNASLFSENQRLRTELELARLSEPSHEIQLGNGFSLRSYLAAHERALYKLALHEAGSNASEAARLLGIEPAAFRARAESLGIRPRRNLKAKT